jgi:uncharacterized protein (DUF2147 family)
MQHRIKGKIRTIAVLLSRIIVVMLLCLSDLAAAADIKGVWRTQKASKNADIEISACQNDPMTLCGKIVALQEPFYPDGTAKRDKNNPDPALRQRPLIGLNILQGFTQVDATSWENGTIYNPENGKVYSCTLNLTTDDDGKEVLEVRGYVGISLFGESQYWVRVKQ